jgi:hypothetical protein
MGNLIPKVCVKQLLKPSTKSDCSYLLFTSTQRVGSFRRVCSVYKF